MLERLHDRHLCINKTLMKAQDVWEGQEVPSVPRELTIEGIENKQRLQTLSVDNAWSNKNFLFYLTFRMLQHTSSEVNGYNCYRHFKKYKNKEGNWWQDKNNDKIDTTDSWYYQ